MAPIARWTGRRGLGRRPWSLAQHRTRFVLETARGAETFGGEDLARLTLVRRWFGYQLRVQAPEAPPRLLRGLRRGDAQELGLALEQAHTRQQLEPELEALTAWVRRVEQEVATAVRDQRWIPEETVCGFEKTRPSPLGAGDLSRYELVWQLLTDSQQRAMSFPISSDRLRAWIAEVNETILTRELSALQTFLDTIEHSPLTEEQARAVVCFDNRVHVIAAAGSGKTSLMVGRAAYAVDRGFVPPERILLLAFNKAAAVELQQRIETRLRAAGIRSVGIRTDTFHAFGLRVIGLATGRKPRVAPWVSDGRDAAMTSRIVDELRDRSLDFRFKWDLFRLLYARTSETPEEFNPDAYDPANKRAGLRTYANEVVKSEGERLIADWLFLNGVRYVYERPYVHDTTTSEHSQYRPDFYYPQVDAWHEHWALDQRGNPSAAFPGYAEQMQWKKGVHQRHGTILIETTWGEVMQPDGLDKFAAKLRGHGIVLDWNPDRHIPGATPVRHEDLARLMRTFMTHVKSNSLTKQQLRARVSGSPRTRLFLDLYWQIHAEWEARLHAEACIDFEDMLVQAAEHLEEKRYQSPYELVMVDEFQDASHVRARLTRALLDRPGRYLLAVGDDWQSINRFAGADLSVLIGFNRWFGKGPTMRLQTTFRCDQAIADAASAFIAKNPHQLRKRVRAARQQVGPGVQVTTVSSQQEVPRAIDHYLLRLQRNLDAGTILGGGNGRLKVDILGRYNFERKHAPTRSPEGLDVSFRTVHSAKGLEADYVIVPNMTNDTYGFPSQIADDPVLNIVVADPDPYPHAEERRLFYVALTRARYGVLLLTPRHMPSPFVAELINDELATWQHDEQPSGLDGVPVCPSCGTGFLVQREGRYGLFQGCSSFPRCRHTASIPRT